MAECLAALEALSLDNHCQNPNLKTIEVEGRQYKFFDLSKVKNFHKLPFCLRIMYESCVRSAWQSSDPDIAQVWSASALQILNRDQGSEILFQPGRVVLQDFTGVAALVDLAAMREIAVQQGKDPTKIDSKCPADLVVDHSVQVDFSHIEKLAAKQQLQREQAELKAQEEQQAAAAQNIQQPQHVQTFPPFYSGEVYYYHHPMQHHPVEFVGHPGHPPPPIGAPVPPMLGAAGASALPPSIPPPPVAASLEPAIPTDNPGLPIQDEVCPFHLRMSYWAETLQKNRLSEMSKNNERFQFLKYVDSSFDNITVIPPGTGVMHQVNLEYLARVVTVQDNILFPDTCVGTDTHTTMVNGLGVFGWTVGTLEAEAVMFDHPLTMPCPKVIGIKLMGKVPIYATSTDVVLLISKEIRKQLPSITKSLQSSDKINQDNVFVEFFGPAVKELSIADRSAVANLCNEYSAKTGFFPVDASTLEYLAQTGREKHSLKVTKEYLQKVGLFRINPEDNDHEDDVVYDEIIEIYLPDIVVTISGPTRPKDKVEVEDVPKDFQSSLTKKFDQSSYDAGGVFNIDIDGQFNSIKDGSILLSSIASCSNTSNPSVMLTAGLLAKKAVEAGLSIPKFVRRSLSPGSGVVTSYLQESGVMPYLHMLGFEVMGYGCSTCMENSCVEPIIPPESLVCCGVLSGNRNFEGRILPEIKANYLASPPLVVAYAMAGRIDIDFNKEPLGKDAKDKPVFLKDIWPSRKEVQEIERCLVIPSVFKLVSNRISYGNKEWSNLNVPNSAENSLLYQWNPLSTFIQPPNYLQEMMTRTMSQMKNMRCLLKLEDNVTCDLISPAGSIVRASPAADYLTERGLVPRQFQSYGTRRGNSEVMARGTFSHSKLKNVMKGLTKIGPFTIHHPSGVSTTIFEASVKYKDDQVPLVVIAGSNFGRGSARDWATKGPYLLGVRAILARSFSPVFKHNMIKTGLLPIQIDEETYKILSGHESFEIKLDLETETTKRVQIVINGGDLILHGEHLLLNAYDIKLFQSGGVIRHTLNGLLK